MDTNFFLEQLLGIVMEESWNCTKGIIINAYRKHKNASEEAKSLETHMYTAIVDAFCNYAKVNPKNARPEIMDFIYTTAEVYFNESQRKQDDTPATLLAALHSLDSKFGDTTLFKNYKNKKEKDDAKIETVANYLQKYIVKDDKFKDEYINEVLTRLLRMGKRIEKMQLEQQLFPEQIIAAVKESEQRINANTNTTMAKESDRVISVVSDKIDSLAIERFSEPYTGQETKHEFEKPKFKDVKTEYADKWNERLFLHRKPGDKALTLKDTFIMPQYTHGNNDIKSRFRLDYASGESDVENSDEEKKCDDLESLLDNFYLQGKSLLIIGYPGIGKSSVLCFLADKYINDSDVLFLKFSDWSEKELIDLYRYHGSLLLNAITTKLNCSKKELENKMLILDGFDELQTQNYDPNVLNNFIAAVRGIKNFKFIITSREGYIYNCTELFEKVITLSYFSHKQIKMYADKIMYKGYSADMKISKNQVVLGIPVILYISLSVGIDITKYKDNIAIYNKVFALKGGVFDRVWDTEHHITYIKKQFYNILCNTAYYMFINKNDNYITDIDYKTIISNELGADFIYSPVLNEFPLEVYNEHNKTIRFVHSSIYEYFVSEYLFVKLQEICIKCAEHSIDDEQNIRIRASEFCILLCNRKLKKEVVEFLKYKINTSKFSAKKYFVFFKEIIAQMLCIGIITFLPTQIMHNMIYSDEYKSPIPIDKNSASKIENTIFTNLLYLIHLWNIEDVYDIDNDSHKRGTKLSNYILPNGSFTLDIANYDFSHISIHSECLCDLALEFSNFNYGSLANIIFDYSDLRGSIFESSKLNKVSMYHTTVYYTNFISSSLINVLFEKASISHSIYIDNTFDNVSFNNAIVKDTYFIETNCYNNTRYEKASFEKCEFSGYFFGCNFSGVTFINCKLSHGNFEDANFREAKFINTDLTGGIFTDADFRKADTSGAKYTYELNDAIMF